MHITLTGERVEKCPNCCKYCRVFSSEDGKMQIVPSATSLTAHSTPFATRKAGWLTDMVHSTGRRPHPHLLQLARLHHMRWHLRGTPIGLQAGMVVEHAGWSPNDAFVSCRGRPPSGMTAVHIEILKQVKPLQP